MSSKKFSKHQGLSTTFDTPPIPSNNRRIYWIILAIAVSTALALSPILQNNFTNWDDNYYVLDNPLISQLSLQNIGAMFTQPVAGNYHPLTVFSLAVNYQFSGETSAFGYLLTNLLLHLINCCLVFYFVYLLSDKHVFIAGFVALLFGVHPMHVESVAWISARKDVLYSLFFLIGLINYWKFLSEKTKKYYTWAVVAFLAALLSKPTAVVFPLVLIWMHFYKGEEWSKELLKNTSPFFLLSIFWGILTLYTQSSSGAVTFEHPWWQQPFFASFAFLSYLFKAILPLQFSAFYPFPLPNEALSIWYYLAPIGVLVIGAWVWYSRHKAPIVFWGLSFFLLNILLTLQLFPVGGAIIAERYTYLPYIGLWWIVAQGLIHIWNNFLQSKPAALRFLAIGGLLLILCAYGFQSFERTKVWNNSIRLWTDVIEQSPQTAFVAYFNRSHAYRQQEQWAKALEDSNSGLALRPNFKDAYYNRALIQHRLQNTTAALADYQKAVQTSSHPSHSHANICQIYFQQKKYKDALTACQQALSSNENFPGQAATHLLRGRLLALQGNYSDALKDYNVYLKTTQSDGNSYFARGVLHYELGDYNAAIKDFDKALQIDPSNAAANNYRAQAISILSN